MSKDIAFDKEGYLQDHTQWSESTAETIAESVDITLTEEHWQVLHALRSFYNETELSPPMRVFVKLVRQNVNAELGNSITLHTLFPHQPAKIAAKIAGLPKPTHCL